MIAFTDLKIGKRYRLKDGRVFVPEAFVSIRPTIFDRWRDAVRGHALAVGVAASTVTYYRSEWSAWHKRTAELVA